MKFTLTITSITALSVFLVVSHANAVEPLSTKELASHCSHYEKDPEGKDAVFCVRYIQGFIDGAVATDERVVSNITTENSREETFSERAMRTRLGKIKLYGSTYYADFCLGEPVRLKEIVSKVVEDLDNSAITNQELLARNVVYQTVRKYYPCKKPIEK